MATVKELFAKHGVENATLSAEVESLIAIAESKTTGIPQGRFNEKVHECNELRADKVELEAKALLSIQTIATQKEEIKNLKGIETEFNAFKEAENKRELEKWNERKKVLTIDDSHSDYDKIQKIIGKFAMGETLTPEQIRSNNNLYETYAEIDYFEKEDNNYPPGGKPGGAKSPKLNPFDLQNGVKGNYRDMKEAIRISKEDPARAKQLQESAGVFKE